MSEGDELEAIWEGDRALTLARVEVLFRAAAALERGTLTPDARRAARDEAHTLAGTAAIFGRAEVSRLAKECQRWLEAEPPVTDASRFRDLVLALRGALGGGGDI